MSVKLFTKTKDVRERKILAACLDMFEIWIDNELVLWPISRGGDDLKRNNEIYKIMAEINKEKLNASQQR